MSAHGDIWAVEPWPLGWTVRHVEQTGSTNTDLLADLEAGVAGDRCVLVTDHQTAGRGRLDRRWEAPPGTNLLVSIAVAPVPAVAVRATHRVGLAALFAAREFRPDVELSMKWPNDLLLGDRKVAGILAQRSSTVDGLVVGLGLNVGWAPDGAARLGPEIAPARLLGSILRHLDTLPVRIDDEYRSELSTIGSEVRVELPGGDVVAGVAVDVDDDGRLVVRDSTGSTAAFDVGDVIHVRRLAPG